MEGILNDLKVEILSLKIKRARNAYSNMPKMLRESRISRELQQEADSILHDQKRIISESFK